MCITKKTQCNHQTTISTLIEVRELNLSLLSTINNFLDWPSAKFYPGKVKSSLKAKDKVLKKIIELDKEIHAFDKLCEKVCKKVKPVHI